MPGVNSLQILAFLSTAASVSGDPNGTFTAAVNELCNATNAYDSNVVNLKVCDL